MKKPRFTAKFTSNAKVVTPSEEDKFLAKASVENLSKILPDTIDPELNPDVLYVASDLFVAGMANKNGHAITIEDSKKIAPLFVNKFLDIEHDRKRIAGTAISYGFTEYGSGAVIENIEEWEDPFNVAYGGVVWNFVYPQLSNLLIESSDINSEYYNSVSSSWEIGFSDYDIAVGSKFVNEAQIITDPAEKEKLEKKYLKKGGLGKTEEGDYVYKVAKWPLIAIGSGFVANPAADVKGVYVDLTALEIENEEESLSMEVAEEILREEGFEEVKVEEKPTEEQEITANENFFVQNQESCVNALQAMKTKEDIISLLREKCGEEAAASALSVFDEAIRKADEEWKSKQSATKEELAKAQEKQSEFEASLAQLSEKVTSYETEIESLKTSKQEMETKVKEFEEAEAARELQEKIAARWEDLDEKYTLDAEQREAIAEFVKDSNDEAYAKWEKTFAVFAKQKQETVVEEVAASVEVSEEVVEETVENALASVEEESAPLNLNSDTVSLGERFKNVFTKDSYEFVKR